MDSDSEKVNSHYHYPQPTLNSKKADSKQERVEIPRSEEPVYAGQEREEGKLKSHFDDKPEINDSKPENSISSLLHKMSVVLSPRLAKSLEQRNAQREGRNPAYVPRVGGLKTYPVSQPTIAPPMGMQQQQPQPQQQVTYPSRPTNAVGGGSNPSANPINSFGALSMSGNLNGNAAFGAKNSPDSSKTAAILKWAAADTPCSCGCGDTVKTCKCGPDCSCRKPGGSCYKGEKKAGSKPGLWANIHAKRKRGEKPAKPGDKDYPDAKSWKKTTKEAGAHAAEKQAIDPISLGIAASGLGAAGGSLAGAYFFGNGPNSRKGRLAAKELADYWDAQKTMNREQHYKKQIGYRKAMQRDPTETSVRNYLKHWGSKGFESDDDWEDLEEDLPFKPFNTPGAFESDYLVDDLHVDIGNRLRDPKQFDAAFRELLPRLNLKTQKQAAKRVLNLSPSWGGGKYQLGENIINPQLGYRHLFGVVPTPDIGLRVGLGGSVGGLIGGTTLGLAPFPYIETDWGRPSGWHANTEMRSLYKWLADKGRNRQTATQMALASLPEDADAKQIEKVLRSQGVGYSSKQIRQMAEASEKRPALREALKSAAVKMSKSPAWQRSEGKNEEGGLNA